MSDFYINLFLDDEKLKKFEAAGLAELVQEIDGKKAVQVSMTTKDKKKLIKGFKDLPFDTNNACELLPGHPGFFYPFCGRVNRQKSNTPTVFSYWAGILYLSY